MPQDTDYYKALKDQNYKELLDSQIQLENARQRAYKNTNAGLAAAGFGSAGYGQVARQGIESQYLQGLQGAQNNFQQQNFNIDQAQRSEQLANEEKAAELQRAEQSQLLTDLYAGLSADNGFDDEEMLDRYLERYGLMKDGVLDQEAFSQKYGADKWGGFNAEVGRLRERLAAERAELEEAEANEAASNVDIETERYTKSLEAVNDELNWLTGDTGFQNISSNFKDGDYIKLSDNTKDGKQVYYRWDSSIKKLVPVDKDEYESKAKHKYWIRSQKGTKDMIVDYDDKTIYKQLSASKGVLDGAAQGALGVLSGGLSLIPSTIVNTARGKEESKKQKEINDNYEEYLKALRGK